MWVISFYECFTLIQAKSNEEFTHLHIIFIQNSIPLIMLWKVYYRKPRRYADTVRKENFHFSFQFIFHQFAIFHWIEFRSNYFLFCFLLFYYSCVNNLRIVQYTALVARWIGLELIPLMALVSYRRSKVCLN